MSTHETIFPDPALPLDPSTFQSLGTDGGDEGAGDPGGPPPRPNAAREGPDLPEPLGVIRFSGAQGLAKIEPELEVHAGQTLHFVVRRPSNLRPTIKVWTGDENDIQSARILSFHRDSGGSERATLTNLSGGRLFVWVSQPDGAEPLSLDVFRP